MAKLQFLSILIRAVLNEFNEVLNEAERKKTYNSQRRRRSMWDPRHIGLYSSCRPCQ